MSKHKHCRGPVSFLLVILLTAGLLLLSPVGLEEARAQSPAVIFGILSGTMSITSFIYGRMDAHATQDALKKIQAQLDVISGQLDAIETDLRNLQNSVNQMAKNLQIDTREIENYIQNVGAQAGIDSIATHYDELQEFAEADVTDMTPGEIEAEKEANETYCSNVLGAWDIRNAVTKIKSAACPDTPEEGVLELWTDQSILKMPGPQSAANDFSLKIESLTRSGRGNALLPIVAERPVYFDFRGAKGGYNTMGAREPATRWYFAEGSCRPGFNPFICINNVENKAARVKISYMLGNGSVVDQSMEVPGRSRSTAVVKDLLGEGDAAAHDFSAVVESTNKVEIVAERVQYSDTRVCMNGGDVAMGSTSPSRLAYFAEGTCRPSFQTYFTLLNPGNADTGALLTYMKGDGTTAQQGIAVPAHTRVTVRPADVLGVADDAAHDFSTRVESTTGAGLVVERPEYFNYAGTLAGSHCASGATGPTGASYLAEGTCRPSFETYFTLLNPGNADTGALLTYMKGDGTTAQQGIAVPAHTRVTVRPADVLGVADDAAHDFSTRVESTTGAGLVVERPEYFNYAGILTGGHCTCAVSAPRDTWHYAEGTVRPGFEPYVCVQNPNGRPVTVRLSYMWGDRHVSTQDVLVPANARCTVDVNDSPAARTVTGYYQSLKTYLETLLYYQVKGSTLVAEAYNRKYMDPDSGKPAPQTVNYMKGSYRKIIQQELDEFLTCVESLVASYSLVYNPGGLVPEAQAIFTDADALFMNWTNALLYGGTGDGRSYYGVFGRAFGRQADTWRKSATDVALISPGGAAANVAGIEKSWRPVRLKYYDNTRQKLVEDNTSTCVSRYHANCEPGSYRAGPRSGLISTGGASPALARSVDFTVQDQKSGGGDMPASLPFGDFLWITRPRSGVLSQSGTPGALQELPAYLKTNPRVCGDVSVGVDYGAYLVPGDTPGCGSINGWGNLNCGTSGPPKGDDFVQLAAGDHHCIALENDGSLAAWGSNTSGQTNCPAGNDFVQAAAGCEHGLALKQDGSLVGWGSRSSGQADCPAGNDFVQVAAGWAHSLALKKDGSIAGWGNNDHGQVNCPAGNDFVQVAAGNYHGVALKNDGSVVGWGSNDHGQVNCPAGNDFVQVSSGPLGCMGLKKDGTVIRWGGSDPGGRVAAADTGGCTSVHGGYFCLKGPGSLIGWGQNVEGSINCPAGNDFAQVAMEGSHGLAVKWDGSLVGWGSNEQGQTNCPAGNDFAQVAAGWYHSLALKRDGSVVGWGANNDGQINCPAGNGFVQVAAGSNHSLALKKDGSVVGWGDKDQGQVNCPAGNDFVQVAAGNYHSLALKKDGSVVGWGANNDGQINCPAGNGFVQVAAGWNHSLALRSDGSGAGWGWNIHGEGSVPAGNDYVRVAGGAEHTVVVLKDASLRAWGRNAYDMLNCPAGNGFVQVVAGGSCGIALRQAALQPWTWL